MKFAEYYRHINRTFQHTFSGEKHRCISHRTHAYLPAYLFVAGAAVLIMFGSDFDFDSTNTAGDDNSDYETPARIHPAANTMAEPRLPVGPL
jgi:hypothetical protein